MMIKRKRLWIGALTAVHAVLTLGAVLVAMSLAMAAFDGKREPGVMDRATTLLASTLMAPLGPVYRVITPREVQSLPFVGNVVVLLNSFLWAAALVWLLERRSRRGAVKKAAKPSGA